jgi:aryl-alcohol dehydrogenase-like predicted oxidoreductase
LSLNRWEPENGIKATRTGLVDSEQVIYSIFDQSPEDELVPACQELNVGVIVRVTLDEGSLGGKMSKDTKVPASGWRSRYFNPKNLANTMERVDKLKQILPPGMSLSQMALRLRRMGLEYVDIIYSHGVDAETPLEETMGALAAMHRRGKAPYVGISSYSPALTAQAAEILKTYGMPLLIHQPSYFHAQPLD